MKILVRAVGRMRDRRLEEVCREYVDRARRHLPVEVNEVETDAELVQKLPAGTEIVALEPGGDSWDSRKLTEQVAQWMNQGQRAVAFLIGGPNGLSSETVARAHRRLSLSPLTLPHRLARVILCEQIYRSISKLRGEPYDR